MPKGIRRVMTESEERAVVTEYQANVPTVVIGKNAGISQGAIYRILEKYNVPKRRRKDENESPPNDIGMMSTQLEIIIGQLDSIIRALN